MLVQWTQDTWEFIIGYSAVYPRRKYKRSIPERINALEGKTALCPCGTKSCSAKRYVIECINSLLKNKVNLAHLRHRSVHNFPVDLYSVRSAYCFFDIKPEAMPVHDEKTAQLEFFLIFSYPEFTSLLNFLQNK